MVSGGICISVHTACSPPLTAPLAHLDLRADALRDGGEPLVRAVRQLLTAGPLALAEGRTVSQEVSAENMTVLRKSDHPGSRT